MTSIFFKKDRRKYSMAVFVEANPPEILRASQKDESYINTIKSDLADIVQRLFGKQHNFLVFWSQQSNFWIWPCHCLLIFVAIVQIGNQTWLKVQWLSDITCVFLYYTLTTLLDNQTLGEEYVGLIQVNSTLRALPSKLVIARLHKYC